MQQTASCCLNTVFQQTAGLGFHQGWPCGTLPEERRKEGWRPGGSQGSLGATCEELTTSSTGSWGSNLECVGSSPAFDLSPGSLDLINQTVPHRYLIEAEWVFLFFSNTVFTGPWGGGSLSKWNTLKSPPGPGDFFTAHVWNWKISEEWKPVLNRFIYLFLLFIYGGACIPQHMYGGQDDLWESVYSSTIWT